MIEKGLVTQIRNGEAIVSFVPSENCASCKGCSCGKDGKSMLMRVPAEQDVEPGDIVTIRINPRALLSSGFIVFILPLIMFIIGAVTASPIFERTGISIDSNTAGIIVGFALMIITFAVVFVLERRNARVRKLEPKIIAVDKNTRRANDAAHKT